MWIWKVVKVLDENGYVGFEGENVRSYNKYVCLDRGYVLLDNKYVQWEGQYVRSEGKYVWFNIGLAGWNLTLGRYIEKLRFGAGFTDFRLVSILKYMLYW